jgi:hypothetical protein
MIRRRREDPRHALPALTTRFEQCGFSSAGFSQRASPLTGAELHYFVRHDCTYVVEFGFGQHTFGDIFMAVGVSHPDGPAKAKFAPLSYFVDYRTTLNRLIAAGISCDEALAESVAPHIEYAARVALIAHSRGRLIPLRADLQDAQTGNDIVEP